MRSAVRRGFHDVVILGVLGTRLATFVMLSKALGKLAE